MIFNLFKNKNLQPKSDFSSFFYKASSREKKKLISDVLKEANKDQIKLIKRYEEEVKSGIIKSA